MNAIYLLLQRDTNPFGRRTKVSWYLKKFYNPQTATIWMHMHLGYHFHAGWHTLLLFSMNLMYLVALSIQVSRQPFAWWMGDQTLFSNSLAYSSFKNGDINGTMILRYINGISKILAANRHCVKSRQNVYFGEKTED